MKFFADLFNGPDKKPSLRKILGTFLVIAGIVQSFTAKAPITGDWWNILFSMYGAVLLLVAMFFFGMLTADKIAHAIKKDKV
jgi:hypothetical protein